MKYTQASSALVVLLFLAMADFSCFAQSRVIDVTAKYNDDNSCTYSYKKNAIGSFYLQIKFNRLNNADDPNYQETVNGSGGDLFTLKPIDTSRGIESSYTYTYIRGVPHPKISPDLIYALPFSEFKTFRVCNIKNLDEKFGGLPPQNWVAYQFNGSPSDTAFAVRKGVVVEIIDGFDANPDKNYSYRREANSILIEHADGTFAKYEVVKKGSIMVKVGETVYPHTPLALFGTFDTDENTQLRLMVYYLDFTDLQKNHNTFQDRPAFYSFVNPFFEASNGKILLVEGQQYRGCCSSALFQQELTNREKKRMGLK